MPQVRINKFRWFALNTLNRMNSMLQSAEDLGFKGDEIDAEEEHHNQLRDAKCYSPPIQRLVVETRRWRKIMNKENKSIPLEVKCKISSRDKSSKTLVKGAPRKSRKKIQKKLKGAINIQQVKSKKCGTQRAEKMKKKVSACKLDVPPEGQAMQRSRSINMQCLQCLIEMAESVLHPVNVRDAVLQWLREDTPSFDYGGFVVGEKREEAVILCKSTGVLAGVPFVNAIFNELECKVEWLVEEGSFIPGVCRVAKVTGKARYLLLGERVALNILSRASGVATVSRRLRAIKDKAGWHGEVAGTRKTTPGFRLVEKYALLVGGISIHRYDLSSMIMLKDNHIWTAGNITQAVKDARSVGGFSLKIEVECRSLDEASEAASAGADVVMLDNFEPKVLHNTGHALKERFPNLLIESSGGVTEDNLTHYMGPHIDIVSLSRTTQGYDVVDYSMKILKEGHNPNNPLVILPN